MTPHERALRCLGFAAPAALTAPVLWPLGHWLAVTALALGCGAAAAFVFWYLCWLFAHVDGRGSSYVAAYLGAGVSIAGGSAIYMSPPYWVYGRAFKRRLYVRRVRRFEQACGLDESAFTRGLPG